MCPGTSAHACVQLLGELGNSASTLVSHQGALQRGSRDTVMVACDRQLGAVTGVRLWHDNRGGSPAWYVSRVIVKDVQTKCRQYFRVTSWLSLENGDGQIDKTFRALGMYIQNCL